MMRLRNTLQYILVISRYTLLCAFLLSCSEQRQADDEPAPVSTAEKTAVTITRLDKKQVEQYIAIQQSINQMMENKRVINTPENKLALSRFQDIENYAIRAQGLPEAQYTQIKNIIIDTQTHIKLQEFATLNNKIITLLEQTLKRHEATRSRVKNKDELALLDQHAEEIREHINSIKNTMNQYTDDSETMRFNREIVNPYLDQLNALTNTPESTAQETRK